MAALKGLRTSIPDLRLLWKQEDLHPYVKEWANKLHGKCLGVALPASTKEVAQIVKWCSKAKSGGHQLALVPQGGNTGLCGGQIPQCHSEIVLSTRGLTGIRKVGANRP